MVKYEGSFAGRSGPSEEQGKFNVSVVVPVLRSGRNLDRVLHGIAGWAHKASWTIEVVLVDDNSGKAVDEARIRWRGHFAGMQIAKHERRRGPGVAARTGLLSARGQYIVVLDPSVATPIENATALVESLAMGADVAVTSRPRKGESNADQRPFLERAAETTFVVLSRLVCPVGVRDTLCGLMAFRRRSARKIAERSRCAGPAFTIEWLAVAEWLGFQSTECPQRWASREVRPNAMLSASKAPAVLRDLMQTRKRMSEEALCGPVSPRELLSETSFTKFDGAKLGSTMARQR